MAGGGGGGGGGAAPAPKADELQPHPVKDQLPNIAYCITSPPPWRAYFTSIFFIDSVLLLLRNVHVSLIVI